MKESGGIVRPSRQASRRTCTWKAVNDQKFSVANLREAILSAEKSKEPIKLLLKREDQFVTVTLDYHGGLRYPHLERVETVPDRLDAILAPSK